MRHSMTLIIIKSLLKKFNVFQEENLMKQISQEKYDRLIALSDDNKVISALAIDQRGSIRSMFSNEGWTGTEEELTKDAEEYKKLVSQELTAFSSSILLDTVYGSTAIPARAEGTGLLLAYEVTGYDKNVPGRLPKIIHGLSVKRLKEAGADAVKFLLYYDVDEDDAINDEKKAFMERVGAECEAEGLPFFLEILSYDANNEDNKGAEFAKVKPHKVNEAVKEFSKDVYNVDVLKLEVPVNMNYVEGYGDGEAVYTREEALQHFKDQDEATNLPYIYLSAGVSAEMFQETLRFANEAGARFNGVLCGRATWKDSVGVFVKEGEDAASEWIRTQGKQNINDLNAVVDETAVSWEERISVK